jgi:hypothetical protein
MTWAEQGKDGGKISTSLRMGFSTIHCYGRRKITLRKVEQF